MLAADPQSPVDAVLAQCAEALRTGRRFDCGALLEKYPEFASEITTFISDFDRIDPKFAPLRQLSGNAPGSAAEIATLGHSDTVVPPPPKAGSLFGDYDLLSEVARGGMGVVYKARQRSLNRVVALKMVLGGGRNSTLDRDRFLVEARAVARLNHPHIVPIYEVGEHGGQPYFTMEFLSGGSLRDRLEELRGDQRAIARLIATVARAVEHAHRRGILHRDLKPTNVLMDERGEPHVTDFGLAKHLGEESDLTQAGVIVGTPSYMAPEQAQAETDLSTAVDVYGVGAMMYELLTGRPPFRGNTPMETMMATLAQDPQCPRQLSPEVNPDLETICLKCLAKIPLDRYGSTDALADDLDRWLRGEPIHARRATPTERLVKWCRRQPVLAGALGTVGIAVLGAIVLAGFLWQNAELRAQAVQDLGDAKTQLAQVDGERKHAEAEKSKSEKLAEEQRKLADAQKALADKITAEVRQLEKAADAAEKQLVTARVEAGRTLYAADMQLAHAAWLGENISTVGDLLGRYQDSALTQDLRGFEWHYLNRQLHGARLSWRCATNENDKFILIVGMAISPDGKTLATGHTGNKLKLWNLADGRLLREFETKKSNIRGMSFTNITGVFFSDDGSTLTAVVRKAFDMRQMDSVVQGAIAKNENLAIESLNDSLEFQSWALADQSPLRVEPFDPTKLRNQVNPQLAGAIFLVDGRNVMMVMAMDRSPDGKFLAFAGTDLKTAGGDPKHLGGITGGKLLIWDVAKKQIHAQQDSPVPLSAVAFSPINDSLAIATSDGAVGLGKRDLAQPPTLLLGHRGVVNSLRFTGDGRRLASGAADGLLLLWDVATAKEVDRLRGHTAAVARMALSADGQALVSGGMDGTVKVWDLERTQKSVVLRGHETAVGSLVFSGDGNELVSLDLEGSLRTWRLTDGKQLREAKPKNLGAFMVRMSPSGKSMVWRDGLGDSVMVRDIPSGKETQLAWKDHVPFMFSISSDDTLLASGDISDHAGVSIWSLADGRQLATMEGTKRTAEKSSVMGIAFSSDGKWIATTNKTGVQLWDWKADKSRNILDGRDPTTAVAFSGDDTLLAVASANSVRIWNLQTDELRAECRGPGQNVTHLVFSPDGSRLATAGATATQQGVLKLWDTNRGREVFSAQVPPAILNAIAFSPDGRRFAAAVAPIDVTANLTGRKVPSDILVWDATPISNP